MKWPRWLRGPLRATPGTAVTGYDKGEVIRSVARQLREKAERGTKRLEAEERKWKYEERESFVVIAKRITDDPRSHGRPYYELTTVTAIEGTDGQHAKAKAWSIPDAEADLLFQLARLWADHRLVKDFDEARERASKVTLHIDTSLAFGSRGFLQ